MASQKTVITDTAPSDCMRALAPDRRRKEAEALDTLFRDVTGSQPRMWGESLIGYGAYAYTYASGRSGMSLATGFSPRAHQHSIYIMPGYQDFSQILARLGPHRIGKSCLYIRRLDRIDTAVLRELIGAGLARLREIYPVTGDP